MDAQMLLMLHWLAVVLAGLAIVIRARSLFSGIEGNLPNPSARKFFVAFQHSAMTLLILTGVALLVMKGFEVQSWFYAKIILFFVLLSSLSKAYKKQDLIVLAQRRAGLFLAVVAFVAILGLVMIQPNFG